MEGQSHQHHLLNMLSFFPKVYFYLLPQKLSNYSLLILYLGLLFHQFARLCLYQKQAVIIATALEQDIFIEEA